jgi:molybdate transport system substrate-binding protein
MFAALGILAASTGIHVAEAAEVVVFSTIAAKSALDTIAPGFERESGATLRLRYATAAELKTEIEKGAKFDVALLTSAGIDDLANKALVRASSKAVVFRSGVGVAVKKGVTPPVMATADDLKRALVEARSIALSTQGATGPIMKRIFEKFAIADAMAAKSVLVSDITAPEAVARGQAELAFTQVSEILDTPGAVLVAPLPPEVQVLSVFSAALASSSAGAAAADAFMKWLSNPSAREIMRAKGLDPS